MCLGALGSSSSWARRRYGQLLPLQRLCSGQLCPRFGVGDRPGGSAALHGKLSPSPQSSHLALRSYLLGFQVNVSDPVLQAVNGTSHAYQVECSTFYARAIGWDGKTACMDRTLLYGCWNVIESTNTGTCSVSNTAHVSVGPEFYTYAFFGVLCILLVSAQLDWGHWSDG